MNSFYDPNFKAWCAKLSEHQSRVFCLVKHTNGKVETCGDPQWGLETLGDVVKNVRRASMDWVPDAEGLEVMDRPMKECVNNTAFSGSTLYLCTN